MIDYTQKRVIWNIEEKPGGGFVARSENSAETLEAPTREEIQAKVSEKIKELMGPELAGLDLSRLPLDRPGSVVKLPTTAKITFSLFKSGGDKPSTFQLQLGGSPDAIESGKEKSSRFPARLNAGAPGAIEPEGGSLLSAVWKAAVLVGIAIIIWLLLNRR